MVTTLGASRSLVSSSKLASQLRRTGEAPSVTDELTVRFQGQKRRCGDGCYRSASDPERTFATTVTTQKRASAHRQRLVRRSFMSN
jgi:hypothetical protein